MEVLNKLWNKVGVKKKPQGIVINISSVTTKSCGNCMHERKPASHSVHYTCAHYPNASMTEVINTVCTVKERQLWTERQFGLLTRFRKWLV